MPYIDSLIARGIISPAAADGLVQRIADIPRQAGAPPHMGPEMAPRGGGGYTGSSGARTVAPDYGAEARSAKGPQPAEFPEGYLDAVPQETRLSHSGISHPGYRWQIYDKQTGNAVGDPYGSKVRASRRIDRLDNNYGGYRYRSAPVRADTLTDDEAQTLQQLGIALPP